MRLSEKTIELTFCHQAGNILGFNMIWFGLTQEQESKLGFDVCTRLNGRLFVVQFKASSKTLNRTQERQFKAPHDQMVNLKRLCRGRRAIYYAFPLAGTTAEIAANPNLMDQTWFLDVNDLPNSIPLPKKKDGTGNRKSGLHYVNVKPGKARICSDEIEVDTSMASSIFKEISNSVNGEHVGDSRFGIELENPEQYIDYKKNFSRNAFGAILLP